MKRPVTAGPGGWRSFALALALLLLAQAEALATPAVRRKRLPPMQPPENIVLRDRPVVVRMPVPPEILADLRSPTPDPKQSHHTIRLHITLPSNHGTFVWGFARRWATVRTPPTHPSYIGYFVILARTTDPTEPPRQASGLFTMTRAQLRRAVSSRTYFPLTLVQVDDRDAADESEYVPRRDLTLHIDRIFFEH